MTLVDQAGESLHTRAVISAQVVPRVGEQRRGIADGEQCLRRYVSPARAVPRVNESIERSLHSREAPVQRHVGTIGAGEERLACETCSRKRPAWCACGE